MKKQYYRLLNVGEMTKRGDEVLVNFYAWTFLNEDEIGIPVKRDYLPIRRPIVSFKDKPHKGDS